MNRISVENPDDDDDRIYLARPVTTLRFSQLLGIKPHEMLVELMKRNVFVNIQDIFQIQSQRKSLEAIIGFWSFRKSSDEA